MLTVAEIVDVAEELLSKRFGGAQHLLEAKKLDGSGSATVIRAKVANQPYLTNKSVVLKFTPSTGDPFDDAALVREVVSYQFTTSLPVDSRPGPELLAYDISRRILVIGDCGDGDTYAELLEVADEKKRVELYSELGHAIGRMHAVTADREAHFDVLLKRMLARFPDTKDIHEARDATLTASVDRGLEVLTSLGIDIPEAVKNLAAQAKRRLVSGQHRAFTPYLLSPDNILRAKGIPNFLDYEWAGFRDATFDVAGVIAGFPQYLYRLPTSDEEIDAFLVAWIDEVRIVWPNMAKMDNLSERISSALIGWALTSTAYLHYGSMSQVTRGDTTDGEAAGESLLTQDSDLGRAAREDLEETFAALEHYCARVSNGRFDDVALFAARTLEVLRKPAANEAS